MQTRIRSSDVPAGSASVGYGCGVSERFDCCKADRTLGDLLPFRLAAASGIAGGGVTRVQAFAALDFEAGDWRGRFPGGLSNTNQLFELTNKNYIPHLCRVN